jgi:hypothetical protein
MSNDQTPDRRLVVYQTATQLVARALMYAAVLVVLPSFISITSSAAYADIVMLSTLAAISTQLDGGHATSLLTLLSDTRIQNQPAEAFRAIKIALIGTLKWAVGCSLIFCLGWLLAGRASEDSIPAFWRLVFGVSIATACAVSNTASRIIFARNFSRKSVLFLVGGPLLTLVILTILRVERITLIFVITIAFLLGYFVNIFGAGWIVGWFDRKSGSDSQCKILTSKIKSESRYWILLTQIISIIIVAKNPILIKILCGDTALATLSIYIACYTLMLAPIAAMQIPILIGFKTAPIDFTPKLFPRLLVTRLFQGCSMTVAVGCVIFTMMWIDFGDLYAGMAVHVSSAGLFYVLASATVAAASVVIALYLTALGRLKFLALSAISVMVFDFAVILFSASKLGGLSPLISIMAANVLSFFVYLYFCQSLARH